MNKTQTNDRPHRLSWMLLAGMVTMATLLTGTAQGTGGGLLTSEQQGKFTIPKMAKPPTLDGTIEPAEWREALAIGGLASQNPGGNFLIMRPTTFYLAWDTDNLYVACRTWIMPGYKPWVRARGPSSATAFDDGTEFNLRPMGANLPDGATSDNSYKFFINCFGFDGDFGRVSVGQIFRNWRPQFKRAVRQTAPGTAPLGGSWWEAEMVFPAKDFELVGPNRAGDKWKMMLAFNHIPGFSQNAVPLGSSYFDSSGWPVMTLTENIPAVQVTMDELPGLKDGVASVKVSAYNPAAEPVTLNVVVQVNEWTNGKSAEDLLKKETTLTVEPGKTAEFKLSEKLPRDLGKNKGGLYIRVAQGNKELYRYFAFLTLGYPENWVKYTPSKEAFPLSVTFNPLRDNLLINADANYLDNPKLVKSARYVIIRDGDSRPTASGEITECEYYAFNKLLQIPSLKEGDYTVDVSLVLADGGSVGPVRAKFKKLDEAKAFAPWWKNKIGDTERVIKPFTPIAVKGQTVTLWGRTFTFNALGLPAAINSQGLPVLAAPARIVVMIDGREHSVDLGGKLKFTEKKDWRVSFTGEATGAGLKFNAAGCVEQDGLVQINLTYAPAGKDPVKVDALRIEYPLSVDEAQAINSMGPGGNFATLSAKMLPTGKPGRIWSTLEMGAGGNGLTVGTFYPDVWIGNEQRGFYWWADSDQGWVPDDTVAAHEVVRGDKELTLRNNIIGKPYQLSAPRKLTFTYNATPFKPFPKGWRATINAEDGTFAGPHKQYADKATGKTYDGTQWLSAPAAPDDWGRVWGEFKVQADAKVKTVQPFDPLAARRTAWVHNSLALMGYGNRSGDNILENYFRPEWDENTICDSQQDYFLWLAKRAFSEGGLRSIYWDIFFISSWGGEQNGMAYRLDDGRLQPTFNGFNLRKLSMRLASLQEVLGLTPGGVSVHSSNCFPFLAYPWIGAALDGEWAFMTDASTCDWVDNYSIERMRALNTPQNYGVPLTWMSLNQITDPVKRGRVWRGFYDWTRFHDCNWYGWDGYKPGDKLLDFGLNDERLQYVPHWRNTAITCDDPQVLVAYWGLPSRVLVMAFNYDGKAVKNPVLKVDFAKLGLGASKAKVTELRGKDAHNGQLPEVDPTPVLGAGGNTVSVSDLQPHTARYFGLRVEDPAALARIRQELAGVGTQLNDAMLDWGLVAKETKFVPAPQPEGPTKDFSAPVIAMWELPDRVLFAVTNTSDKAQPVTIDIALDKLGLVPQLPWQEFVRVRDFNGGSSTLDFHGRKLSLGNLKPGQVRLVGVRRY